MSDYIDREAVVKEQKRFIGYLDDDLLFRLEFAVKRIPAADVVARDCFDQILWERDVMEDQLSQIGKALGAKMDDVRPVVLCRDCVFFRPQQKSARWSSTTPMCSRSATMYDELIKKLRNRRKNTQSLGTLNDDPLLGEAADAIEELSKPKWIPVTEQLPEPCVTVLICRHYYGIFDICFGHTLQINDHITWSETNVVCWMPIPEPPKDGES